MKPQLQIFSNNLLTGKQRHLCQDRLIQEADLSNLFPKWKGCKDKLYKRFCLVFLSIQQVCSKMF